MEDIKYANAYSEVLEILKYIPIEDYNKIPKTKIKLFETNANNNYSFNYNPNKTLQEQEVSKIAKGIIAILFRDYWATEIQREKIISKQKNDRRKIEEQKREKYDPDNIFKNKIITRYSIFKPRIEQTAIVEYKKKNFLQKLFDKIKYFFKIK